MSDDLLVTMAFEQSRLEDLAEAQQAKARKTLAQLRELVDEFHTAAAHVRSDADLSGQGRANRLAELAVNTADRLEKTVGAEIKDLDARLADLDRQLTPQPPAADAVHQFLIEKEIRDLLRDMDALEIQSMYEAFARNGGEGSADFMRACENAPAAFPLIADRKILEGGKRARALREARDTAELLRQLRTWRNMLAAALQSAEAALGLPGDDPVRKVAAGDVA